jgi:hypothetical protein
MRTISAEESVGYWLDLGLTRTISAKVSMRTWSVSDTLSAESEELSELDLEELSKLESEELEDEEPINPSGGVVSSKKASLTFTGSGGDQD